MDSAIQRGGGRPQSEALFCRYAKATSSAAAIGFLFFCALNACARPGDLSRETAGVAYQPIIQQNQSKQAASFPAYSDYHLCRECPTPNFLTKTNTPQPSAIKKTWRFFPLDPDKPTLHPFLSPFLALPFRPNEATLDATHVLRLAKHAQAYRAKSAQAATWEVWICSTPDENDALRQKRQRVVTTILKDAGIASSNIAVHPDACQLANPQAEILIPTQ